MLDRPDPERDRDRSRPTTGGKEDGHLPFCQSRAETPLSGISPLCKTWLLFLADVDDSIVPQDTARFPDLRQHFATLSPARNLPSIAASHIPLLPRSVCLLQQSFPPCTESSRGSLRAVPRASSETALSDPHLPHRCQHHPRSVSIASTTSTSRRARPRLPLHARLCGHQ